VSVFALDRCYLVVAALLMPTVNDLTVVGIVTLPGMVTGQILTGASPLLAMRYQTRD
jgi:putative ABC transport system permease protein